MARNSGVFQARGVPQKRAKGGGAAQSLNQCGETSSLRRRGRVLACSGAQIAQNRGILSYARTGSFRAVRRLLADFAGGAQLPSAGNLVRGAPAVEDTRPVSAGAVSAGAVDDGAEAALRR